VTLVYGILTAPTGRPLQRQRVLIRSVNPGNPFTDFGSAVARVDTVDTDTDGRWDTDLIPSSGYEYAGQYYTVDWRDTANQADAFFAFTVPDTGGPLNFRDLLVTPPVTGVPIPPVTAHALGDHIDVDTAGAVDGDVLTFVLVDGKWEPQVSSGGGPGGSVDSVTAADATIVIGGTSANPTVRVNGAALTNVPQAAVTGLVAALAAKYTKPGPGIPSSDLTAAVQSLLAAAGTAVQPGALAAVAFSGAYADLTGRPALAPVATSGAYADLTGRPVLAPVATSGAYADLTGQPTIPSTPGDIGAQPADADLTAIAGLAPADGAVLRRAAGAWTGSVLVKADVGLSNVDNTADSAKPVSTAQQTALDGKQPLDSDLTAFAALAPADDTLVQRKAGAWTARTPAQVKTDLGLTKADVGLGAVDNTADSAKPVSTAQAAAIATKQDLDADLTAIAALAPADDAVIQRKASAWTSRTPAQLKTDLSLTKADVGLSAVDNTADSAKPVSTAQAAAIATKQDLDADLTAIAALAPADDALIQRKAGAWTSRTPAQVKNDLVLVKADVGLGSVDNTADTAKPVSIAQAAAIALKQDLDADLTAIAALAPGNGAWIRRSGGTWIADDGVFALTDAATIATDAAAGAVFTVTLAGNRTLGNPTNSRDGMKRTWRFRQDATGTRTITLGSDFVLGSNIANTTLTATAGKVGYLTAMYDSTAAKWHVLAFEPGA